MPNARGRRFAVQAERPELRRVARVNQRPRVPPNADPQLPDSSHVGVGSPVPGCTHLVLPFVSVMFQIVRGGLGWDSAPVPMAAVLPPFVVGTSRSRPSPLTTSLVWLLAWPCLGPMPSAASLATRPAVSCQPPRFLPWGALGAGAVRPEGGVAADSRPGGARRVVYTSARSASARAASRGSPRSRPGWRAAGARNSGNCG